LIQKVFNPRNKKDTGLSEKVCAVCGKALTPKEIQINELRSASRRRKRYLCSRCRRREYEDYMKEMKRLIEKFEPS